MTVVYETNRYGDKVAVAVDAPGGYVPAEDNPDPRPIPGWMEKILGEMNEFNPIEKT